MNISIIPSLRTNGGETCDIMIDEQYAGTMALVYRENDRIYGSVQLDQDSLSVHEKEEVSVRVKEYVQSLIDALSVQDCDVFVTFSELDHIIATPEDEQSDFADDWDYDAVDTETEIGDIEYSPDAIEMVEQDEFELVAMDEADGRIEYHVIDVEQNLVAEVIAIVDDSDVRADIVWNMLPTDDQISEVTDLIVSDFNDDVIETFLLEMKYKERTIETVQLAHNRLLKDGWLDDQTEQYEGDFH